MAETSPSQSRLTVLTGPLAGRELVLEEAVDNILIGSDEACRFHLPTPGVEPIHARLWMDASGVTVYETHSGRGLYVNDDRVNGQAPLRNGDILWLGAPGDDDVVMIQCRLPVRAPAVAPPPPAPAPPIVAPEADQDAEETMVIVSDPGPARGAAPEAETSGEMLFDSVSDEVPAIEPEESTVEVVSDEAPPADFVIEETQAMAQPEAPPSEGFPSEEGFPFPPPPQAPHPAFEDETEAQTLVMPESPMEPTVAMPPAHEPEPQAPPASEAPTVIAPPTPTPPPIPAPVRATPPPTPRPPATPAARPPRPAPAPREARPAPAPRPKKAAGGGGSGLYVVLGLVALAVLGGGGFFAWRYLQKGGEATTVPTTMPPPTTTAAAPVTQPPVTAPPETQPEAPPTTTAPVEESVTTTVKTPAPPSPSPVASKAPPSPSPAPAKTKTPPTTVPAGPSEETLRAQQIATLLGQADAAAASHNYEQAAGLYDQVLRLDPANAKAGPGKATAMGVVTSLRKSFVASKTTVRSGKAAKGGPAGFDSEDVNLSKAPDYSGRIEFEVAPPHVKPGDSYTVHVFLTNDGKKSFKIGSLNVTTSTNGTKTGGPAAPAVKEVQPQQRVALQDAGGTWTEGTNSWSLDVDVVSDHGDTFKSQLTWR